MGRAPRLLNEEFDKVDEVDVRKECLEIDNRQMLAVWFDQNVANHSAVHHGFNSFSDKPGIIARSETEKRL